MTNSDDSERARAAAGDKNVGIWGGANIIRQYLKDGLLDEMQIHLIPVLLGGGVRLFEDLDPEGIEFRDHHHPLSSSLHLSITSVVESDLNHDLTLIRDAMESSHGLPTGSRKSQQFQFEG